MSEGTTAPGGPAPQPSTGVRIPAKVFLGIWASVTASLLVALVVGAVAFYNNTTDRLTLLEARTTNLEEHVKKELKDQGETLDQIYDIVNNAHPRQ